MVAPTLRTEEDSEGYEEILRALQSSAAEGRLQLFKSLLLRLRSIASYAKEDLESVLETAAFHGRTEILTYLLDGGVRLSPQTPAKVVYRWQGADNITAVYRIFLERGWDVNAITPLGTVLSRALKSEDIPLVMFLLSHGADINMSQIPHQKDRRQPIGTPLGMRPLDLAASCCTIEMVQLLLDKGAKPSSSNALHQISQSWSDSESRVAILDLLLDQGMDIDAIERVDNDVELHPGWPLGTALHYAAKWCNMTIVKALLERGANPTIEATHGYGTALDWAKEPGGDVPDPEVVEMLSKALDAHRGKNGE